MTQKECVPVHRWYSAGVVHDFDFDSYRVEEAGSKQSGMPRCCYYLWHHTRVKRSPGSIVLKSCQSIIAVSGFFVLPNAGCVAIDT